MQAGNALAATAGHECSEEQVRSIVSLYNNLNDVASQIVRRDVT